MPSRSKLNSIERKIPEALINNETIHELFMTTINQGRKQRELKESITMINNHRSDVNKITLTEEGKKLGVNEVIKDNKIINNSLKPQI